MDDFDKAATYYKGSGKVYPYVLSNPYDKTKERRKARKRLKQQDRREEE